MNFKVVDEHGRQLAMGRNLAQLRAELGAQAQASLRSAGGSRRDGGAEPARRDPRLGLRRTARTHAARAPQCATDARDAGRISGAGRSRRSLRDRRLRRCRRSAHTASRRSAAPVPPSAAGAGEVPGKEPRFAADDADAGVHGAGTGGRAAGSSRSCASRWSSRRSIAPALASRGPTDRACVRCAQGGGARQAQSDRAGDCAAGGDHRGRGRDAAEEAQRESRAFSAAVADVEQQLARPVPARLRRRCRTAGSSRITRAT